MEMDILRTLSPAERIKKLDEERKAILRLTPEKALDAIMNSPHSVPLVHSFPEQDFFLLMHDIGPEDFLPVLSMASARQWEYILDVEIWEKDRINIPAVTRWMGLLAEADANRLLKWALEEKLEFLEFYLFKNIEVRIREHDEDPSIFGNDFFTLDNVFYIRFVKDPFEKVTDQALKHYREELLEKLLKHLAAMDPLTLQKVLQEATGIIPAELEEEAYRLRNVRLAEKGFLPFEEALGIYYPIKPEDIEKAGLRFIPKGAHRTERLPVPMYQAGMLDVDNYFSQALQRIDTDEVLMELQAEFAGLCNQIIIADQKIIREKTVLQDVVRKACGFINIGLQAILQDEREAAAKPSLTQMAALLQKYPLSHIFRVGYGLALDLKRRADQWLQGSWFKTAGLPLSFWDEEWMGLLGGLLIKRPLYFDNFKTGVIYREFSDIGEINATDGVIRAVMALDRLFSLMSIDLSRFSGDFLTYKNLLLTLWARDYLGLAEADGAIESVDFKTFFAALFSRTADSEQGLAEKPADKISPAMKGAFLSWLSRKSGLSEFEISRELAEVLENLFNELENEYGRVALKDLDPKFIHHFCIKQP